MSENRRQQRINEILDEMHGKNTINQIRLRLKKEGLIPEFDVDAYELDWTRRVIEAHGRTCEREGCPEQRHFNLSEVLPTGELQNYYKKPPEMTLVEGVQALHIEAKRCRNQGRKFWRLYDALTKIHGKQNVDRQLTFRLPERQEGPDETEE
jgi:hypothetical protein